MTPIGGRINKSHTMPVLTVQNLNGFATNSPRIKIQQIKVLKLAKVPSQRLVLLFQVCLAQPTLENLSPIDFFL